jgi:single-stranded-DNA-specific exonuclease
MEPVSLRRWRRRGEEPDGTRLRSLTDGLGVGQLTARVLGGRGHDLETGRTFLDASLRDLPDPGLLSGMDRAVERLRRAIAAGEAILVHGDYDVDGISGCALLVETLRRFGANVDFHIPLRLTDGYGLSANALQAAADAGVRVVLSVDCGVSAHEEARLARQLGLDLIVTDHHQPPDPLPEASVIVNPHLPGDAFPGKDLAGVGVAFFLLVALRRALREADHFESGAEPDLRTGLDLVALGTIADLVPLTAVNRILVRSGLLLLDRGVRPGVKALADVARLRRVTCGTVGFQLAPRLNAAGRLEDAALGVELLLTVDSAAAAEISRRLDACNQQRRRIEEETLRQATEQLAEADDGQRSIVLADERWHAGVIGIVASRLVERYHRPTVLVALDGEEGKGSARSVRGLHLYRALDSCRTHLEGFGGHEAAAGLTVSPEKFDGFVRQFEEVASQALEKEDLVPELSHDGEILIEELGEEDVHELARLAPFGMGNPEPAFVARNLTLRQVRPIGTDHLRFIAQQDGYSLPCVAWRMAGRADELQGPVDLLFTPEFNEWKGRRNLQLRVRDFRKAES